MFAANSFVAFVMSASQDNEEEGSEVPPTIFATALYKLTTTFPCSDTLTGIRVSAFAPVKDKLD